MRVKLPRRRILMWWILLSMEKKFDLGGTKDRSPGTNGIIFDLLVQNETSDLSPPHPHPLTTCHPSRKQALLPARGSSLESVARVPPVLVSHLVSRHPNRTETHRF